MNGEYYLHENGKLIYKPHGGVDETSDMVVHAWRESVIGKSPLTFILFLGHAFDLGARKDEIERLAKHNNLSKFEPDWRKHVYNNLPEQSLAGGEQ